MAEQITYRQGAFPKGLPSQTLFSEPSSLRVAMEGVFRTFPMAFLVDAFL